MYFCAPLINFAKPYGTKKQETALTGLSDKEVLISREKYGNNLLTPPKRPSMWKLYLEKFRDPVIRILLVAAFFSLVIAIIEMSMRKQSAFSLLFSGNRYRILL